MEIRGKTLAERVRSAISAMDFTQDELAEQAQLSKSTLQDILYNKTSDPGIETVSKIAKALNVGVSDLIEPARAGLPDFAAAAKVIQSISEHTPSFQRIILAVANRDVSWLRGQPDLEPLIPLVTKLLAVR